MSEEKCNLINHVGIIEEMNMKVKSLINSIEWAPLRGIPMKRRLEVISAFMFIAMVLFSWVCCAVIVYLLIFRAGIIGQLFLIAYLSFMISDIKADENGIRGQGSAWVRSWSWWKHFANYFPVKLIKTTELPPNKNYLFACFPHGVIGCGLFCNFATNATGFNEMFPGIRSKMCTLSFHFYVPFFRELALSWGLMSAKYVSIKHALSQSTNPLAVVNKSDKYLCNAAVVVVGGAQEALYARPNCYQIQIRNRKGFIKAAIETGASLVPVFSFGEVDVYDQPSNEPGSKLRKFQETYKRWTGIAPAIFIGRGFFQKSFGIIPRRNPIYTVVGTPIAVVKNPSPSKEDVNNLHQQFMDELDKLFQDHKVKYINAKDAENIKLIMI